MTECFLLCGVCLVQSCKQSGFCEQAPGLEPAGLSETKIQWRFNLLLLNAVLVDDIQQ